MKCALLSDSPLKAERLRKTFYRENFSFQVLNSDDISNLDDLKLANPNLEMVILFFEDVEKYRSYLATKTISLEIIIIADTVYDFLADHDLLIKINSYFVMPLDYRLLSIELKSILFEIQDKKILRYVVYGPLTLDLSNRTLSSAGNSFFLKNKEFHLAKIFLENPRKILSKMRLLECVWDFNEEINTNTLEVHICNLRKKFKDNGINNFFIKTVPCLGYQFLENTE